MVFNATFNIILAISWRSVLLVEETKVLGQNHFPFDTQELSTLSEHLISFCSWWEFRVSLILLVVRLFRFRSCAKACQRLWIVLC